MRTMPSCLILALMLVPAAGAAAAQDAEPSPAAQIIRAEDSALTCVQIADEAATLSQRMGGSPRGGLLSRIGGVARAGVSLMVPGAGLAMAGADAVTKDGRDNAEAVRNADENRWYYLNGLSAGRACEAAEVAPTSTEGSQTPAN